MRNIRLVGVDVNHKNLVDSCDRLSSGETIGQRGDGEPLATMSAKPTTAMSGKTRPEAGGVTS